MKTTHKGSRVTFRNGMPRKKRYVTDAEKQRAYRARKKAEALGEKPPSNPNTVVGGGDVPEPVTPKVTAMNAKSAEAVREQMVRDRYDYAPSEARTEEERHAAAERILSKEPTVDLGAAYRAGYAGEPCPDPDNTPVCRAWAAGLMDRRSGLPAQAVYRPFPEKAPETKAQAAALGRRLGAHEADRRGEHGQKREIRIANAERYAVGVFEEKRSRTGETKSE